MTVSTLIPDPVCRPLGRGGVPDLGRRTSPRVLT
jgi:hypothetical protein